MGEGVCSAMRLSVSANPLSRFSIENADLGVSGKKDGELGEFAEYAILSSATETAE